MDQGISVFIQLIRIRLCETGFIATRIRIGLEFGSGGNIAIPIWAICHLTERAKQAKFPIRRDKGNFSFVGCMSGCQFQSRGHSVFKLF